VSPDNPPHDLEVDCIDKTKLRPSDLVQLAQLEENAPNPLILTLASPQTVLQTAPD
jgi:hypothetical protein